MGGDVVRVNSAHGARENHLEMIQLAREVEQEAGVILTVLYDLAGPKIRVGSLPKTGIKLKTGEEITIREGEEYFEGILPIECPGFADMLEPGKRIFINDGVIQLTVLNVAGISVAARVDSGGLVTSRKGVNLPDTIIDLPALSEQDVENLKFGLENGADLCVDTFGRYPAPIGVPGTTNLMKVQVVGEGNGE